MALRRKAERIDRDRWSAVEDLLDTDEARLHNTPAQIAEEHYARPGTVLLTNMALYAVAEVITMTDEPRLCVPFEDIRVAEARPLGDHLRLGVLYTGEDGVNRSLVADLYPGPLSAALCHDLERLLAEAPTDEVVRGDVETFVASMPNGDSITFRVDMGEITWTEKFSRTGPPFEAMHAIIVEQLMGELMTSLGQTVPLGVQFDASGSGLTADWTWSPPLTC